jgi:hypothetical protein
MQKVINVLLIFIITCLLVLVWSLESRVKILEAVCHSACLYGDKDCVERCAKAGHCPFQN